MIALPGTTINGTAIIRRMQKTGRPSSKPRPFATRAQSDNSGGSMKQLRWLVCLIVIALLGGCAMAQTPTGTRQGLVTDKTGAAIQGASITIIRTATNEARNTVTDSAGRYSVPFVEPSTYTVVVDAKGFRSAKQENILVQVTETRPVDFKLDVGTVSQ